jgi:putative ABC transport system permease protein
MACAIAVPIAWIGSDYILQSFAFRVNLQWWVFVVVIVFVFGLAFLTIGSQTVRAATTNPIDILREE